jgi:catechol 2,3-dioxygenase
VDPGFPNFKVSHFGLFVFDIDLMVDFFSQVLGVQITDRGTVRGSSRVVFMSRDPDEHHQIVLVEGRTASPDEKLLNQISLRVSSLDALRQALELLKREPRVSDIDPCNHGNAFSVYFRDPEGNRFELYTDSPFYVQQAVLGDLDLEASNEEVIASTKARHQNDPTFRSVEDWRSEFRQRLVNGLSAHEGDPK